jgi:orotidine-5'-phosphate decarboxylase
MAKRNFMELLQARWDEGKFVCVGLDSDDSKIPEAVESKALSGRIIAFNQAIVDATMDIGCAYKPNVAFYEKHGSAGWQALDYTIRHLRRVAPEVPVIIDYKRGDIGTTNHGYVASGFKLLDADAVTVHPYLGAEAMKPFLDQKDKGIIVLCRTSNPGAGEFQDQEVTLNYYADSDEDQKAPLYQLVAVNVANPRLWNYNGNCCVVVGATYPAELAQVRKIVGDMPILIPGIGAQGGDLEATVKAGANSRGQGMIINNSRGIIFASSGADFAEAARAAALKMHNDINAVLAAA